jgi:hypothetical protein
VSRLFIKSSKGCQRFYNGTYIPTSLSSAIVIQNEREGEKKRANARYRKAKYDKTHKYNDIVPQKREEEHERKIKIK